MKQIRISVIIPLYNGALLIERCLKSVFTQKGKFELEVIIIDDGSTDSSLEIIKQIPYPITILNQANRGPAAARNKGIQLATGQYLAFLDADDYWEANFLQETTNFLLSYKESVAVSVGQNHKSVSCDSRIQPQFLNQADKRNTNPFIIEDFFKLWREQEIVCTGSVLMHTTIAKQIGGQREHLRVTEDLEFWACIATLGKWGFIPKILFTSDGVNATQQQGWFEKNIRRWESAPLVEVWEERILSFFRNNPPASYYLFQGKIAGNLIYSMIMSKRIEIALETFMKYKTNLPKSKLTVIYNIASSSTVLWKVMCKILIKREYNRKV